MSAEPVCKDCIKENNLIEGDERGSYNWCPCCRQVETLYAPTTPTTEHNKKD